jgi:hypothetical protein
MPCILSEADAVFTVRVSNLLVRASDTDMCTKSYGKKHSSAALSCVGKSTRNEMAQHSEKMPEPS